MLQSLLVFSMPRAEAGISGGLPLFECSSFGLAPSKTCLQKQELNNFLVFHLLAAAILSGLCSIMQNLSFMCSMYIWRSFLLRADWPKLTALSMRGGSTVCRIPIPETWLQALLPLRPAAMRMPVGGLQNGTQSSLLYLFHTHVSWLRIPSINLPHMTF